MTQEQKQAMEELISEFKPVVNKIENSLATTKGHYGDYMSLLSTFPANQCKAAAIILCKAGANSEGVLAAYGILTGTSY